MTETNSSQQSENKQEPNLQEENMQEENSTSSQATDEAKDLQTQLEEMTNIAKRAMADLQNFQTQMAKERQEYAKFAKIQVLESFLPILDNLNLALKQTPTELQDNSFIKGIEQIQKQLIKITENLGLTAIPNNKLNPLHHEIISSIPGTLDEIIEVIEQGYTVGEKVIKPSKVVVGNGN